MEDTFGTLDASIQEKIDADVDFQTSLASLSDEEKEQTIKTKKSELLNKELADLKEKAGKTTKAEELANNQKIRAEKAEGELKKFKPAETKTEDKNELSSKDTIALINAKVHEEDVDDVVEYAKFKKIPVAEALKSGILKATLTEKAEFRKTADATNTRGAGKPAPKVTDADILKKAEKGDIPAKGTPEAEALFWARRGGKR